MYIYTCMCMHKRVDFCHTYCHADVCCVMHKYLLSCVFRKKRRYPYIHIHDTYTYLLSYMYIYVYIYMYMYAQESRLLSYIHVSSILCLQSFTYICMHMHMYAQDSRLLTDPYTCTYMTYIHIFTHKGGYFSSRPAVLFGCVSLSYT